MSDGVLTPLLWCALDSLREDIVPWTNTVVRLLESSETACQLFNQRLASHRPWVLALLIKCTNEEIRNVSLPTIHLPRLLAFLHGSAACRCFSTFHQDG